MRTVRIALVLLICAAFGAACSGKSGEGPTGGPQANGGQTGQAGAGANPGAPDQPTNPPNDSGGTGSAPAQPSKPPAPPSDPVKDTIRSMTLDQKLGQMIIAGIDGTKIDEQAKRLIAEDAVGGFILYKPNIETVEQTVALLNALKDANKANPAPLLLSVDQEGGKVDRMPPSFVPVPSSREIAKSGDSEKARAIGEAIGAGVRALGFNVDFAPVLDIDSNPNNPVIGSRSFGPTAAVVSSFGIAEMSGLQAGQVVPVVKHFPGHGDTSVDSHLELPVVNKTLEQLRKLELVPFAKAIEAKADAVMIAHILLPQLDTEFPSSMSAKVIADVLRTEMGFEGVVITDDMTMGAIVKHYDLGQAAVRSVRAGADIVLVAHEYANAKLALGALKQAVESGQIAVEAIDRRVYRILTLKTKYKLSDAPAGTVDMEPINAALRQAVGK
ncbi:beta-N-acetylhexosaminidase [Paenibacillus hodogayensis]|uniref:Beta-N-acetylhexosaminidase n=1 Tax=Paenibacillus hodogayensis TaxID=279208 RepID=A0ABV5W6M1_9BACL